MKLRRHDAVTIAAVAVVGALLAVLLLWPLAEGVRGAFTDGHGRLTFAYVATVFRNPIYLEGLRNALAIAVLSTAIAGTVGVGAALVLHRFDFPGRRVLAALVPLPLLVPPFVGAVGMKYLLGRAGALNALLERIGIGDPHAP
ncbi:MAG TPA: iron ABC transporter permease, partial [Polyangia bacterium]|nr:iron ABC transporter permease [Polyangia bacterium]